MRQYIKKFTSKASVVAAVILICLLSVSAISGCTSSKATVNIETEVTQPNIGESADLINTETEEADTEADKAATEKSSAEKSDSTTAKKTEGTAKDTTRPPAITKAPETEKPAADTSKPSSVQNIEQQVVELVNQVRKQHGLGTLTLDEELSNVARVKSNDMAKNNYFSHTSPTYGSPFDMMKRFGISYRTAGENIAMGQTTAKQVFDGWMNSEGHRANILNQSFTKIGVGYTSNGHYWTQMFIG